MEVARHPVGIQSRVDHMMKLLDLNNNDVRMVGIHGEGGLGKTTISKAVYNELHQRFEGSCFILNVRENSNQPNCGLVSLQKQLLKDILKENEPSINDVEHGISVIKRRIKSKRILLVLDDVDSREQLGKLAGDRAWFGAGSRIIISTRDEGLLDEHRVVLKYQPKELDSEQSLQLFSRHAFESDQPLPDYVELSKNVVEYAGGMPLALEVFGPIFFPIRKNEEWMDMLGKLKDVQREDLSKRLRISYEALNPEEKCIFLDIACCSFWCGAEAPQYMWKGMRFHPSVTIRALKQKSLVKSEDGYYFEMHDQIRDMGRNLVKEEAFHDPGQRSRLWVESEILPQLEQPRENLEVIILECDLQLVSGAAFAGMRKLRFLHAENVTFIDEVLQFAPGIKVLQLRRCKSKVLAFETSGLQELAVLDLSFCEFSQISWNPAKLRKWKAEASVPALWRVMPNLKVLKLFWCPSLTVTPDFCGFPRLEKLTLDICKSLTRIDDSIGQLINLTHLSMDECDKLKHLPDSICELKNLETLNLDHCRGICELPERLGELESLNRLNLSFTGIRELPTSTTQLTKLAILNLRDSQLMKLPEEIGRLKSLKSLDAHYSRLERIPDSIGKMSNLSLLNLSGCRGIHELPETLGCLELLEELDLRWTNVRKLPTSTIKLTRLSTLYLWCTNREELPDCSHLEKLLDTIGGLKSLERLHLSGIPLRVVPDCINSLSSLQVLGLCATNIKKITVASIIQLTRLSKLDLSSTKLEELPEDIGKLESLEELGLYRTLLKRIPHSIGKLVNLHTLCLSDCSHLEKLPDTIGELKSLEELYLDGTPLRVVPDCINSLSSLKVLDLSGTNITKITVASIIQLTRLSKLDLSGTKLEELPEDIGKLESLEELWLDGTLLKRIPHSIGELVNLHTLSLSDCSHL